MARTFAANTKYATVSAAPVTAAPLSMHWWINPPDTTTLACLGGLFDNASANAFYVEVNRTAGKSNTAIAAGGSFNNGPVAGAFFSANTWTSVGALYVSATSRYAYVNGTKGSQDTTSDTPANIATTEAGGYWLGASSTEGFSGPMADFSIWNVALTDGEWAALAAGVRPYLVRPGALVGYWTFDGLSSPEPDFSGNANNMTLTGSPAAANGPPITLWTPKFITPISVAADTLFGQACL